MYSTGLSERQCIQLIRNFKGPGVLIHRPKKTEFITLYAKESQDLDSVIVKTDDVNNQNDTKFRLSVGLRQEALFLNINLHDNGCILKNLCVDTDEELWMATNQPNKYCIYGIASSNPI